MLHFIPFGLVVIDGVGNDGWCGFWREDALGRVCGGEGSMYAPESGSCKPGLSLPPADSVPSSAGRWKTTRGSLLDSDNNNKPHPNQPVVSGVCLTQGGPCGLERCLLPSQCRSREDSPSPPPSVARTFPGPCLAAGWAAGASAEALRFLLGCKQKKVIFFNWALQESG